MESKARKIHSKAEIAREKGDFVGSLKYLSSALISYQQEGDYLGIADLLTSRYLTYKHLYSLHKDDVYMILAKHTIEAAVEIAEKKGNESSRSLPYYNLAQFYDEFLSDYKSAIKYYKISIQIMRNKPPKEHKGQLPGLIHNMSIHLHSCEYKAGMKLSIHRLEKAIEEVSKHLHKYERDVWTSGGYMKIAYILKDDDREKALESLRLAEKIIEANKDLRIRKRQWKELAASFK